MDVRLVKILDKNQYSEELIKYKQLIEDRDIEEQRKLHTFLDTSKVSYTPLDNGMYYLLLKKGKGNPPEKGDLVKINYTGTFLNGNVFESTCYRKRPFEFTYGEQGQVIKGLENGINLMNEGSKAKFIIPSHLAFGASGSSTGIVPPYATVIYEIELLNLNPKIIN